MTFDAWMQEVDKVVEYLACVSVYELPDMVCWHDLYDDGASPRDAAREALRESGLSVA
jgi:hypothetical protein